MRGISEHGAGYYFLINNAEMIPKYVGKATDDLLKLIGIDSALKIRGKNGTVLKKVFDHEDLISGAKMHDIRESNMRQLVAQLDVVPVSGANESEILTWELSFTTAETKILKTISGNLIVKFTHDEQDAKKEVDEVLVALRIQEVGELDKTVLKMLDEGKPGEALIQKSIAIEMLKEVQNKDTTGFISRMLPNAERNYEDLKNKKKNAAAVRKNLDYTGYLHRRASIDAMCDMELNDQDEIAEDSFGASLTLNNSGVLNNSGALNNSATLNNSASLFDDDEEDIFSKVSSINRNRRLS